jgi:hypothetical protein
LELELDEVFELVLLEVLDELLDELLELVFEELFELVLLDELLEVFELELLATRVRSIWSTTAGTLAPASVSSSTGAGAAWAAPASATVASVVKVTVFIMSGVSLYQSWLRHYRDNHQDNAAPGSLFPGRQPRAVTASRD